MQANTLDRSREIDAILTLKDPERLSKILSEETKGDKAQSAAFHTLVDLGEMDSERAAALLETIKSVAMRRTIITYLASRRPRRGTPAPEAVRTRGRAVPALGSMTQRDEVDWRELAKNDPSPDIHRMALLREDE